MSAPQSFELRSVSAGPVGDPILRGIDLDLHCEGITAIAGPSGAGKSTLLRLLDRLDDPTSGAISWDGRPLASWDPAELRRQVAMVWQRPPVFAGSVLDNLAVAGPGIDRDRAIGILARVGLDAVLLDRAGSDLSGGEAQRMCIARALLTEPSVLLADEPTSSLDREARRRVERLGRELADDGMPIVWVTHDVEQLRAIADRVVVMSHGRVVATGQLADLDAHDDPIVRRLVGAR